MKVYIGYEDGSYVWSDERSGTCWVEADVPESTFAFWEAVAKLDHLVNDQIRKLDNEAFDKAEKAALKKNQRVSPNNRLVNSDLGEHKDGK